MKESDVRKLVRQKILEGFQKTIDEKREENKSSIVSAITESELRYFIRSRLREANVRTDLNEVQK